MVCLLLFTFSLSIKVHKIYTPPIIDGNLESIWTYGDSIITFTQWSPHEGQESTESTKVYIVYDEENIYIAFRCVDSQPDEMSINIVPRDCPSSGDIIWIMLDTFGDKNTAYEFGVNAAGVPIDDKLSDDGRVTDVTWDGVWYSATQITDYGYNVEMKIPFKTLRFKPGLTEWGINFFRYISRKNETDTWAPIRQSEGLRVSRCGILKGIHPGKQGLHLEVYPVALGRYETGKTSPEIGLDLNWSLPSSYFAITTYPDFAQIEADPYTINLSKYELYFDERRPFL
ncbi:MAG: carbohydrate binding family 9 domain-containing protein, partial [Candidatus Cloacimonadia bacterium]